MLCFHVGRTTIYMRVLPWGYVKSMALHHNLLRRVLDPGHFEDHRIGPLHSRSLNNAVRLMRCHGTLTLIYVN